MHLLSNVIFVHFFGKYFSFVLFFIFLSKEAFSPDCSISEDVMRKIYLVVHVITKF